MVQASSAIACRHKNSISKAILVNNSLLPSNVILDAKFLDYNYSRLLYSGALILVPTLEGFVSVIENSFLNNSVFDSMKIILSIFSELNNGQQNLKTIENLCYASYQAGIIQNHCSVGITHSFAHQLSSFGVSHGVANALFLSTVIEFNKYHTDKYNILVDSIGMKSIKNLVDIFDQLFSNQGLFPL